MMPPIFQASCPGWQITVSTPSIIYELSCLGIFDGFSKENTLSGVGIEDWVDESNTHALAKLL
jgi:hypothetical protein